MSPVKAKVAPRMARRDWKRWTRLDSKSPQCPACWAFGNSAQPGEVPEAGDKQNDDATVIEEEKSENVWLPIAGVIVVLLALVGLAMYFVRKRNSRRTV